MESLFRYLIHGPADVPLHAYLQGATQAVGACLIAGAPSQACLEPIPFSPSTPLSPAPSQPWRESSGWLFAHFHTTRARPGQRMIEAEDGGR